MRRPVGITTRLFVLLTFVATFAAPRGAHAQLHGGTTSAPVQAAPKESAQFDFLVGQWEITAEPKAATLAQRVHGVPKLAGTWKAWRAFDGYGIEDEIRLTDKAGNPNLLTNTTRFYETKTRHWVIAAIDVFKGQSSQSTAEFRSGDLVVSGRGVDSDGKAYISRATFLKIAPASFTYRLDRSFDDGKTWSEGITLIEAKRVAATAPR